MTDGGRILRNIIKNYIAFYYAYLSVNILSLLLSIIIIIFSLINYKGFNYIFFILISLYVIFKTYQDHKVITINILRDVYLKDILLKKQKVIKIKLRGLQSTNKILDIIKTFCFNKYYVIYIFSSSKLIGKINEREIALGLQQYGNITLEELLIKNNRRNTNDRIKWRNTIKSTKPARYVGGEVNSVVKDKNKVDVRFAFCFPDVYEVGMSHLGLKIIYHLLNERDDVYCERAFAPWTDMEQQMRENNIPLYALESKDPLYEFDFVGFTLQYEMSYTNILNMLDMAKIPFYSHDRDKHPFIVFGGPCAYNPEPLADIADLFVLGEGEEVLNEIIDLYKEWKKPKVQD